MTVLLVTASYASLAWVPFTTTLHLPQVDVLRRMQGRQETLKLISVYEVRLDALPDYLCPATCGCMCYNSHHQPHIALYVIRP